MSQRLRLLLDQGVPRDAAEALRNKGHDAAHVGELGMFAASDIEILTEARARQAAVVTLDADFHAILAVSGAGLPSVVRIRQQGLKAPAVVRILDGILARYANDLLHGCLITVKERKTTCHLLPVGTREAR